MSANVERVLVIGGGGFIGRSVISALLHSNFSVSALDLFKPNDCDHVDWSVGSVGDETLVAAAAASCSSVIYLAASSLPGSSNADMSAEIDAHVKSAVKTAEVCCAQGVRTFVFASSGGTVYGEAMRNASRETDPTFPQSAYGVSKLAIENYLGVLSHLRGLRCISLRVANPYGPGQRAQRSQGFVGAAMKAAIKGERLPCWGDGSIIRDFIHVDDVASAFVKGCSYDGPSVVINVGSGHGRALKDVIGSVEQATGRRIEVHFLKDRPFDVQRNVLDIGLAAELLDWQPRISFEDGLSKTAQWWQENAF